MENSMEVPQKTKTRTSIWACNPTRGIYPEKTIIQEDTCTPICTVVQFTIARTWKQPKCPSTEKWIKKMWYIYTMEHYSAIKRNTIRSFVEMWMDLENVMHSEVSQKKENTYCTLMHICMWKLNEWYRWSYMQSRKRDTVVANKCMDTSGGRRW